MGITNKVILFGANCKTKYITHATMCILNIFTSDVLMFY